MKSRDIRMLSFMLYRLLFYILPGAINYAGDSSAQNVKSSMCRETQSIYFVATTTTVHNNHRSP